MANVPSPIPALFQAGVSIDQPFQPLAECGADNLAFYHTYFDDFDPYRSTDYTVTASGTGAAVAGVAGDGGLALFTAGTTAGNASIQRAFAPFTVKSLPKKVFFESRQQLAVINDANITMIVGLIQSTVTPGTVTDGVYFQFVNGVLTLNSAIGSVITTVTIPANVHNITAATNFDLGFYINRSGDILGFVDSLLVGYVTPNLIGTAGNPQNAGAVTRITAPSLTTANLTPTLAIIQAGTNAGRTMTVDFFQVQKER